MKGECIVGSPKYPESFTGEFLPARGSVQATKFAFPDGTPMLHKEFDAALGQLLTLCGIQMSVFKGHSFRIGAATAAALHELSGAQMRSAGRWASDPF